MTHRWTLDRLRRSGRSHLASAQHVLRNASGGGGTAVKPGSAAYLAHVALECVLKAHVLYRGGCASAEDLRRKNPKVHADLFQGKHGHDLQFIADSLRLPELMKREGKRWSHDDCWNRITSSERPYSLRYGVEDVGDTDTQKELQRTSEIVAAVLAETGTVPLMAVPRHRRR